MRIIPTTSPTKKLAFITGAALLAIVIIFALGSSRAFDRFNKDTLVKSAFQADLTPYIAREKTSYSDGCLQFYGISKSHPLFLLYFSKPYENTFHVSFLKEEFNDPVSRNSIYLRRIGDSFDGYVPVVAYIPKDRILVIGYSDGSGG